VIYVIGLLLTVCGTAASVRAAEDVLRFRLYLADKHGVDLSTPPPLSPEAFARRARQGIPFDSTDYPVYEGYKNALRADGFQIVSESRWLNTVVISVPDSSALDSLVHFPFVRSSRLVWMNPSLRKSVAKLRSTARSKWQLDTVSYYGRTENQVEMLGLDALHSAGFKGKGLTIAVLDAGFRGVDTMSWFQQTTITASRDFVFPPQNIFLAHYHGTSVLSVMACQEPYLFVGAAPEAKYLLLRTEDDATEFPIEEDYWVAGAEYADSLGADIINSSLGYTTFDLPALSYTKSQLDGKTGFATQGATLAAGKGILVVVSAGNEGEKMWRKIGVPADADGVLTVGSVQSDLMRSTFSSIGPTADGRIKPDIMAMGHYVSIINGTGVLTNGYGTSFSAPLVAGMAACLWQSAPSLTAAALRQKILASSDRFAMPDSLYGYGIPNVQKAWLSIDRSQEIRTFGRFYCYPSPAFGTLHLVSFLAEPVDVRVVLYDVYGRKLMDKPMDGKTMTVDVNHYPVSIYLVEFWVSGSRAFTQKIRIQR
jgi:hypothetical protein